MPCTQNASRAEKSLTVEMHGVKAGILARENDTYTFAYLSTYKGPPVSLTMPVQPEPYTFDSFPAFFDGLLPEGILLEALLRNAKLDRDDYMGQLRQVGADMVGAVTIEESRESEAS